jgi:hypothetical protein
MALQVEHRSPGIRSPAAGAGTPRNLRLLEPWVPDEGALDGGGDVWTAYPARWAGERQLPASANAFAVTPAQPSAMSVMRQLLDAWRSAERQLASTVDGSAERSRLLAHVATLRSLYQGLFVRVRSEQSNRADPGSS